MKRLASSTLIALFVLLSACDEPATLAPESSEDGAVLSSAKGPKGPPPPGTIFFAGVTTYGGDDGTVRQMDASGGNVESFPSTVTGLSIPSREAHGGYRWFLHVETVPGTYTDGVARQEVFATGAQPGNPSTTTVQLTDDPTIHPRDDAERNLWWSPGDEKIGFKGRRLDATGHVTDGGLFVLEVSFDAGTPAPVGSPALTVPTAIQTWDGCVIGSGQVCEESVLGGFDWSPSMDRIVYAEADPSTLRITGAATDLADGWGPRWSPPVNPDYPDGRIIFNVHDGQKSIWTVEPDGSNLQKVVSVQRSGGAVYHHRGVSYPTWSPTGEHFVYKWLNARQPGMTVESRIYRVRADGSGDACLTCRDFEHSTPLGWW